jgi:hypothetical protein
LFGKKIPQRSHIQMGTKMELFIMGFDWRFKNCVLDEVSSTWILVLRILKRLTKGLHEEKRI